MAAWQIELAAGLISFAVAVPVWLGIFLMVIRGMREDRS